MNEATHIEGLLIAIHWPESATQSTLEVDLSHLQEAKAEIEDNSGITHRLDVIVSWDADYLIGKEVTANSTDDGVVLSEKQ